MQGKGKFRESWFQNPLEFILFGMLAGQRVSLVSYLNASLLIGIEVVSCISVIGRWVVLWHTTHTTKGMV